jgi:endonuclease/exonuclease/phosphatase family metal-dependent hydrolase
MDQPDASLSIPIVVSVATMNVGNDMAPDDRLIRVIREMQPDILALEELTERQAARLADALADTWPHRFSFGDSHEGRGVFSRHPIRREEKLEIATGRPDGLVEVDLGGQALTVLVGHPRPPKLKGRTLEISFASHRQLLRLADLALAASPAVLLGDFNIRPDNTIYTRLRERGLVDAFAASGEGAERTFPVRMTKLGPLGGGKVRVKTPPLFRIDYVWHTPDIRSVATWVGGDTGSDHLPVMSRLAVPRDPRTDDGESRA